MDLSSTSLDKELEIAQISKPKKPWADMLI